MRRRRIIIAIATMLLVAYIGGYLLARSQQYLVRYGRSDQFAIRVGVDDFPFNPAYEIACISYYTFSPLRWLETAYWRVRA